MPSFRVLVPSTKGIYTLRKWAAELPDEQAMLLVQAMDVCNPNVEGLWECMLLICVPTLHLISILVHVGGTRLLVIRDSPVRLHLPIYTP